MNTLTIRVNDSNPQQTDYEVTINSEPGTTAGPPSLIPSTWPAGGLSPSEIRDTVLNVAGVSDRFRKIGEQLLNMLTQEPIGSRWRDLRADVSPFRTLLDIRPRALADLPWEFLYDPVKLAPLFLDSNRPIARVTPTYNPEAPVVPIPWPIRVLVVIGSDDSATDREIHAEDEVKAIREAIRDSDRMIHVDVVRRPSERVRSPAQPNDEPGLIDWLRDRKPHILHFIGHSDFKGGPQGNLARLVFRAAGAKVSGWGWTPSDILFDFAQRLTVLPRLVILNACRTGVEAEAGGPGELDWSLAGAFLSAKVPALIAVQADARGNLAGAFSRAFYIALAEGKPVDLAVVAGRQAIYSECQPTPLDRRDWAIPVLTLAEPPESVLPVRTRVPKPVSDWVEDCPQFEIVRHFVDRMPIRLPCQSFDQKAGPSGEGRNLLVIHGPPSSGKTAMVNWCLEACSAQGLAVRRISLSNPALQTWTDLLLRIRDGDPTRPPDELVYRPLPAKAFEKFDAALAQYRQGKTPEQVTAVWNTFRAGLQEAATQCYADDLARVTIPPLREALAAYQKALFESAGEWPLYLVFDGFRETLAPGEFGWLWTELFTQIGRDRLYAQSNRRDGESANLAPLRVILELTESAERNDYNVFGPRTIEQRKLCADVEVDLIPFKDFPELAYEYFVRRELPDNEVRSAVNYILEKRANKPSLIPDPWKIDILPTLFNKYCT